MANEVRQFHCTSSSVPVHPLYQKALDPRLLDFDASQANGNQTHEHEEFSCFPHSFNRGRHTAASLLCRTKDLWGTDASLVSRSMLDRSLTSARVRVRSCGWTTLALQLGHSRNSSPFSRASSITRFGYGSFFSPFILRSPNGTRLYEPHGK